MNLTIYQIDAFTNKIFGGNPAAVIPLDIWLDDALMQNIAYENNLSETVFFVPSKNKDADYDIRWFTPITEINLCGHATLASAFVLFELLKINKSTIIFSSKSGLLHVNKDNDIFSLNFPSWNPLQCEVDNEILQQILGINKIISVYKNRDLLVELENEAAIKNCNPNFALMKAHYDKIIITAKGNTVDFVSRFFAPGVGIDEDPVTGSSHSQLIPYWNKKLNKQKMVALQLSKRGGKIWCTQLNETRVSIAGQAVFFMQGDIKI